MDKCLTLFLMISLSSCNGHLGKLSGLLLGAHQQIHNKVHDVAGAVLGGLSLNVQGHVAHHQRPPAQPARPAETIVVVQETDHGRRPQRPYDTPQQGQYQPNQHHNPNGYNQNYNQNTGYNPNPQQNNPGPNPPVNYGQGPYQNEPTNDHNFANGNSGQQQNIPNYSNQHGQATNYPNNNQNDQGNNNLQINNVNPNNDGNGNPNNLISINHDPNGNVDKNPNLNDNYKPTETYNGQQHNDVHQAENTHKETNDKTTTKPVEDGSLFVPLNDYTYGGDKIVINPPKRDTGHKKQDENEEDFPIDIRFKDE